MDTDTFNRIFYFVSVFYVIVSGKDAVGAGVQLLYFAPGMVRIEPLIWRPK